MNFLSGQDEFRRGQDDFFQTANQPISVRHLSLPYNKALYKRSDLNASHQHTNGMIKFGEVLMKYIKRTNYVIYNLNVMNYNQLINRQTNFLI